MMCQRIGRPPSSTIGLGFDSDSSANRLPNPPASRTVFTPPPSHGRPRPSKYSHGVVMHLPLDPSVRHPDSLAQRRPCLPAECVDPRVAEVPRLNANGPGNVPDLDPLSAVGNHGLDELLHADVLRTSDVRRHVEIRPHQPDDPVDEIVDVGVRTYRRPVTPNLDHATVVRFGNLATDRGRSLFAPSRPGAFGSVAVLKARNADGR